MGAGNAGSVAASDLPTARGKPASGAGSGAATPTTQQAAASKNYTNAALQRLNYTALSERMEKEDTKPVEESKQPGQMPPKVDLKNRGYLQPDVFMRRPLDFQKNNLQCSWAKSILYDLTKLQTDMVLKFNSTSSSMGFSAKSRVSCTKSASSSASV